MCDSAFDKGILSMQNLSPPLPPRAKKNPETMNEAIRLHKAPFIFKSTDLTSKLGQTFVELLHALRYYDARIPQLLLHRLENVVSGSEQNLSVVGEGLKSLVAC